MEVQQQNFSDMAQFGDGAYEPSADELIDVLKNLENLAALNPGLYRTIVEQIKGKQNLVEGQHCQLGFPYILFTYQYLSYLYLSFIFYPADLNRIAETAFLFLGFVTS